MFAYRSFTDDVSHNVAYERASTILHPTPRNASTAVAPVRSQGNKHQMHSV